MNSQMNAKHSTKSTRRSARSVLALTPTEALGMLASAVSYLQGAGLTVKAGNDSRLGLVLAIEGARVTSDSFGVMHFESVSVASISDEVASTPEGPAPSQAVGQ
jgi:hypothetical protein